jgi:hypothetical protein
LLAKVKKIESIPLKIVAYQGAQPTYAGTKYDKTIKDSIQKLKDTLLGQRYKKLLDELKKLTQPLGRIERLKAALAEFASSKKYKAAVEKLLKKEQDGLEKNMYNAIQTAFKKEKTDAGKVRVLESRKGDLKSETYRKKIEAQIKKLNDAIKKADQVKRDKALKTSYDRLMKKIGVKGMKSAQKITTLETEKAAFTGSSYEKKIADQIAKLRKGLDAEAAKDREAKAKKAYDAVVKKLVKAKTTAACDANIAKLQDLRLQVGKTGYAKKVDSLIKKERATKKKLEDAARKKQPK